MKNRILFAIAATGVLLSSFSLADIPRTSDGKPDLSGTYNIATITPLQRPVALGETLTLSQESGLQAAAQVAAVKAAADALSDPNRQAPPAGGDGSPGPAGNVGGYNSFWIDFGDTAIKVNGEYRTSIITDPPNGRQPEMTPVAGMKMAKLFSDLLHETPRSH